jgi:hypothetical protein
VRAERPIGLASRAVEEMQRLGLPMRLARSDCVMQHRDHRRDADARGNEYGGALAG